jgi:hypothetical protein
MSEQQEVMDQKSMERELLQKISLGMDMEAFAQSAAGRHLIERSEQERVAALESFKDADPENPKAIRTLQFKVAVIDTLQQWIADAIQEGENAERSLLESGS